MDGKSKTTLKMCTSTIKSSLLIMSNPKNEVATTEEVEINWYKIRRYLVFEPEMSFF